MAGIKYHAKKEATGMIEDCNESGMRFVFFSKENDEETVAFAINLGLDTDWNTVISLSACDEPKINQVGAIVLPTGIDQISQWLSKKDDVPLKVSIFTNSDIPSVKKMFELYQEYGEVIMCIGSSSRHENI